MVQDGKKVAGSFKNQPIQPLSINTQNQEINSSSEQAVSSGTSGRGGAAKDVPIMTEKRLEEEMEVRR